MFGIFLNNYGRSDVNLVLSKEVITLIVHLAFICLLQNNLKVCYIFTQF